MNERVCVRVKDHNQLQINNAKGRINREWNEMDCEGCVKPF